MDVRNTGQNTGDGSVVCSEGEKPQLVDGVNLGKSRKIDGNWYHVVKK